MRTRSSRISRSRSRKGTIRGIRVRGKPPTGSTTRLSGNVSGVRSRTRRASTSTCESIRTTSYSSNRKTRRSISIRCSVVGRLLSLGVLRKRRYELYESTRFRRSRSRFIVPFHSSLVRRPPRAKDASFRFVSFRFVSFRFVSFRFVSFRFVSFRFAFRTTQSPPQPRGSPTP